MEFLIEPRFPEHPRCYRAVCEACGVGDRRDEPVFNIPSVSIDHEDGFYTSLWLCSSCVTEWGRGLGMLTPDQAADLHAQVAESKEELKVLRRELKGLQAIKEMVDAVKAPRAPAKASA